MVSGECQHVGLPDVEGSGSVTVTLRLVDAAGAIARIQEIDGRSQETPDGGPTGAVDVLDTDAEPKIQNKPGAMTLSDDPVRDYMRRIGEVGLLNAEQEVELAKRIEAGLFAGKLLADEVLLREWARSRNDVSLDWSMSGAFEAEIPEEELLRHEVPLAQLRRELSQIAEEGRRAKHHMVEANLRLVVSKARPYRDKGVPDLDLYQEGALGVMEAVDRFDYTKGYKFSTFAAFYIRNRLTAAFEDQARTICAPGHVIEKLNKIWRVRRQLIQDLQREPTDEEIATGVDNPSITVENVTEYLAYARRTFSLDACLSPDDDSGADTGDVFVDRTAINPADAAVHGLMASLLAARIHTVLGTLSARDVSMAREYYGVGTGGGGKTFQQIADAEGNGMTKDQVRRAVDRVKRQLRECEWLLELAD